MFKIPEWKYLKYKIHQKWTDMTASRGYSSKSYKGDSLLERLSALRILLSTHPVLKISIGALCAVLIIVTLWISLPSSDKEIISDSNILWFYDINTAKLFTSNKMDFPPIETDSGPLPDGEPAGVIANVLTYDPTGKDESQQFIAFLEKLTEKGKLTWTEALETDSLEEMQWETDRLIKKPEDKEWVEADSPRGIYIRSIVTKPNEKGQIPEYVNPD
ncbi:MAG: hypothetical protein FVQ82_02770 [Planctomycetes bacterium]|nr:hypothetical protein [Planctomycetota bacterium]